MKKLSAHERYEKLMKASVLIEERKEDLARTITLEEGKVIYQYAFLVGKTTADLKLGFVCAVEVGNADDVYVELYNDGDLKPTASSGKAFWEVNEANLDYSLETRTIKSNSYYELGASTADKVNNNEQKCKFILDVDKGTKGLFQNYDVSLGLFVYDDTFSDTMAELSTADITMELKAPRSESTRLNSSHTVISYAVFCLKKKKTNNKNKKNKKHKHNKNKKDKKKTQPNRKPTH